MEVGIWMTRELVTVRPETPVSRAALAMSRRHVRRLPVTTSGPHGPRLAGIVSLLDIARACPADRNPHSAAEWPASADVPVAAVMTRDVRTVTPATPIEEAAQLMRTEKIGALPVVQNERLVGLLTESDVLDALLEIIGVGEAGVRVTLDARNDEDVLAIVMEIARAHGLRPLSLFSMRHRDRESGDVRTLGVVRLAGAAADALIDAVWRSGHRVRSVLRTGAEEAHGD